MKKFSLFILLLFCILLTGCGDSKETKEVGSLDQFLNVAVDNGFQTYDNMETYTGEDYITGSKQAILDDITIEMVIYDNDSNAKKVQDGIIDNFMTIKGTGVTANKDKGENYYKFTMVSNGYYMVCSRIDNTLIFSKTLLKNKEKVEKFYNDMNY